MFRVIFIVCIVFLFCNHLKAQTTRDINPYENQIKEEKKTRKLNFLEKKGKTENYEEEWRKKYEDNIKRVKKQRETEEKLAKKPQYSDFSYFGHKKKPKKRPPGKMKYCKECGLKH